MDVVGFTVGVVALAGLFSTCIDCFDLFEAAHALEEESKILLVKLDLEKTRLLIWGNAVGIVDDANGSSSQLGDIRIRTLVERCLESIRCLLTDSDKLQERYGLQLRTGTDPKSGRYKDLLSSSRMNVFRTSYRRFQSRSSAEQERPTLLSRTKWAIHDRVKFESLINHLKDFLDGLNQILPVPQDAQDRILQDDITSILDISKLRLIQTACEGPYQSLSDVASAIVERSECGATNRPDVEEWIENAENTNIQQSTEVSQKPTQPASVGWSTFVHPYYKIVPFFVLTQQCLKLSSTEPCRQVDLGKMILTPGYSFIKRTFHKRNLGSRITETLDPRAFVLGCEEEQLYEHDSIEPFLKTPLIVAHIYIYCAPCVCQIHTAIAICTGEGGSKHLDFRIRIDDRLDSSCCLGVGCDGLVSVIQVIKEIELELPDYLSFEDKIIALIDRPWIEQRIYEIEENEVFTEPATNPLGRVTSIFADHVHDEKCASIVILGEAGHYALVMQQPPFLSHPRMPRETEVFQMKMSWNKEKRSNVWQRKYMGTYSPTLHRPNISPAATRSSVALEVNISTSTENPVPGKPHVSPLLNHQTSPPLTPSVKRRRSSSSGSDGSDK